ncbi:MAG: hypothetical protein ACOCV7_03445, partial [Desulfonatronovibrionaceae bacterium]
AHVGWLYYLEKSTQKRDITERELVWQIEQAVKILKLEDPVSASASIDRLLQYRLIRRSITESGVQSYCLTRLGRGLAGDIMSEVNLESEELFTFINHAYSMLNLHMQEENPQELTGFIRHVFLNSVADNIEYKLQSIEESILEQELAVKELGGGHDDQAFELAVSTIKTSRQYLEELLQTLQTGSPYYPLYELFYECRSRPSLQEVQNEIESCLDFLDGLRKRIEQMLGHIINFVHECVAYQNMVGSLSYRDRLCRRRQDILTLALSSDLRIPVFQEMTLRDISMNWSSREQKKPVHFSLEKLKALEEFIPEQDKTGDVFWKQDFLNLARSMWQQADSPLDLGDWISHLLNSLNLESSRMLTGLWILLQDMPAWDPAPGMRKIEKKQWLDMGAFYLEPVVIFQAQ